MTFPVDMQTFLAAKSKELANALMLLPSEVRHQHVYLQSNAIDDDTPCLMVLATRQHPNKQLSSDLVYLWSRMEACSPSGNQCIGVKHEDLVSQLYKHIQASCRLDLLLDEKTKNDPMPSGSLAVTFTDSTDVHEIPVQIRKNPFKIEDREWTHRTNIRGRNWTAVLLADEEDNTVQISVSGESVTAGKYEGTRVARTRLEALNMSSVNEILNHIGLSSITENPFGDASRTSSAQVCTPTVKETLAPVDATVLTAGITLPTSTNCNKENTTMNKKTTETTATVVVETPVAAPAVEASVPAAPVEDKPKRVKRTSEQVLKDSIKEAQELLTANGYTVQKNEVLNEGSGNVPAKTPQLADYIADLRANWTNGNRILASLEEAAKAQLNAPKISEEDLKSLQQARELLAKISN